MKTFLFFDVETTGFPDNWAEPITNVGNWPEIVQIGWQKTDESGFVLKSAELIIKPNGYIIPQKSTDIHGITTAHALEVGVNWTTAAALFASEFSPVAVGGQKEQVTLVAHNMSFDKRVVGSRLYSLGGIAASIWLAEFNSLPEICTMKASTNYCALPNKEVKGKVKGGYKYPQLKELYFKIFGVYPENQHSAGGDVEATRKAFFKLVERGIIKLEKPKPLTLF